MLSFSGGLTVDEQPHDDPDDDADWLQAVWPTQRRCSAGALACSLWTEKVRRAEEARSRGRWTAAAVTWRLAADNFWGRGEKIEFKCSFSWIMVVQNFSCKVFQFNFWENHTQSMKRESCSVTARFFNSFFKMLNSFLVTNGLLFPTQTTSRAFLLISPQVTCYILIDSLFSLLLY